LKAKKRGCVAKMVTKLYTGGYSDDREEPPAWTLTPRSNGVMREAESILLCVRWYLRYALSYRDLEEMMLERGLQVDHTTIYVRRFGVCEISPRGR
jgi:ribosomal protein S4E